MFPENISTILEIERLIVLLPAPVLPTIPTFSPGCNLKERLSRTISVVGLYLNDTFSNSIYPCSGHLSVKVTEFF